MSSYDKMTCWTVGGILVTAVTIVGAIGYFSRCAYIINANMYVEVATAKANAWVGVAREIGGAISSLGG